MSLRDELLRRFPRLAKLSGGCYVVGGAVRDLLLGLDPLDVDVACTDPLTCARRVSERVIRLGSEEHLSAYRVVDGEHIYDFAELLDGDIGADLARRDFTINAMAVDLANDRLIDPHGGRQDLDRRLVRMVDEANFDDDPLRCLKAVRMAVQFGFAIDEKTLEVIRRRAGRITEIAAERVTYELSVIFSANQFRRAVELLRQTGLDVPLFDRPLHADYREDDISLAGAYALLVDDPRSYAKRWRWSSDLLRDVTALQRLLSLRGDLRIILYDAGERVARQLPPLLRALGRDGDVPMPDFSARALLSGREIASLLGIEEGPELGRLKRALLEAQIRGEVTTHEAAVEYLRRLHA